MTSINRVSTYSLANRGINCTMTSLVLFNCTMISFKGVLIVLGAHEQKLWLNDEFGWIFYIIREIYKKMRKMVFPKEFRPSQDILSGDDRLLKFLLLPNLDSCRSRCKHWLEGRPAKLNGGNHFVLWSDTLRILQCRTKIKDFEENILACLYWMEQW